MKILFAGDSLTRGNVGASYVSLLTADLRLTLIKNIGSNGDTMNAIADSVLKHLRRSGPYDYIILQGGANDLLLPEFGKRGGLFGAAARSQYKKDLKPCVDAAEYYRLLRHTFREIQELKKGRLVFITMSCLGEDLLSPLNKSLRAFNAAARRSAEESDVQLADVEFPFRSQLQSGNTASYLIDSFWSVTLFDRLFSLTASGRSYLSRKRGLKLTIDGAHLNDAGAVITKDCVRTEIRNSTAHRPTLKLV